MNIGPLFEHYAEILEMPLPTAAMYKRRLVESGFMTQGGRGRVAPHATSGDAALAILALIVSPRPSTAPRYVTDFGNLVCVEMSGHASDDRLADWLALPPKHTLATGIARLIDLTGSEVAASIVASDLGEMLVAGEGDQDFKIVILDTLLAATITIGHLKYWYNFVPAVGEKPSEIDRYYRRPIESSKAVGSSVVFAAGEAIHGKNFRKLVFDRALLAASADDDEDDDEAATSTHSETEMPDRQEEELADE